MKNSKFIIEILGFEKKLKENYLWRQGVARFARCLQRYKLKLEK